MRNRSPITYTTILYYLVILLCSSGIFAIAFNSINSDTFSDPKLNFVVSQAILEHGTIYLDAYESKSIFGRPFIYYRNLLDILSYNDHYYHYHPAGASILSLPFVWIALQSGMDMLTIDNFWLQNFLSACSLVLLFWLLLAIGRIITDSRSATVVISTISILGSGLMSTLGVAFWTLNYTALFFALIILLILRWEQQVIVGDGPSEAANKPSSAFGRIRQRWHNWQKASLPIVIGILLFAAFFARASAVAFIVNLFAYLLWRDRRFAIKTMATSAILFALFLLWSRVVFGRWLPDYYEIERITIERLPVYIGLLGNLVSPSRGLLIFSPMYAVVLLGLIAVGNKLRQNPLFWLCLAWFSLTLFLAARAATWYGGWSFGPRLLTDATLAWVIITFLLWSAAREYLDTVSLVTAAQLYLLLGVAAIFINSYQGLYNQATSRWNAYINPSPNIHAAHPWGDIFHWQYAQWRADYPLLCKMERDTVQHFLDVPLPIGRLQNRQWIDFFDEDVITYRDILLKKEIPIKPVFVGWSPEEANFRWTGCPETSIFFDFGELVEGSELYTFTIRVFGIKRQRVEIYLNGHLLSEGIWNEGTAQRGEFYATAHFSHLHANGRNELLFRFPDLQPASRQDQRWLGFAFAGLKLEALAP